MISSQWRSCTRKPKELSVRKITLPKAVQRVRSLNSRIMTIWWGNHSQWPNCKDRGVVKLPWLVLLHKEDSKVEGWLLKDLSIFKRGLVIRGDLNNLLEGGAPRDIPQIAKGATKVYNKQVGRGESPPLRRRGIRLDPLKQ